MAKPWGFADQSLGLLIFPKRAAWAKDPGRNPPARRQHWERPGNMMDLGMFIAIGHRQ